MKNKRLYLVIPCYNEEVVLRETAKRLNEKFKKMILDDYISKDSKILFVDDGSKDSTWNIIEDLNRNNTIFIGLKLSRNKGHQNALLAGLMTAKEYSDMVISLDADLQDDINVIDRFVEEYYNGNEIVYGVRSKREKDTFFKRFTAESFYKLMKALGVDIIFNHADYRLMSKRTLEALSEFKEVNLFLRGIIPLIGFKSSIVVYERNERFAGSSKYPFKKMLSFAFDGITSFSVKPIRIITAIGTAIFVISTLFFIYSLIMKFLDKTIIGWTSLICSIWMIGGIQLLCLGVIGEYIGKIYGEVKARPKYIIEKKLFEKKDLFEKK
ncbi:glycosyltransferase involved in cell wall biogenesis [Clostridium pasteurianum DSM 525 = ATCC 6013]|uniref:Glycosyl transferase family 2 n=1 Tax=Clostridium pasteurianum DSM 525 = ATCC 6013 TaxID=1262449 RepID=A0A0H3J9I5_CLOPA|nr:glycosyltransferase family 2 protein [Clostridium pasteurianum]AJA47780.1 glycosyltransferase involved in cell wall biogenesis [Clostridium pasteurianum DSM 525 = ATCC 6013]AJA51768.1 glycosyltransferase involved in cell wall biogenesis [Clostridium pasteurianum DSM 525 = ATCC 6013]AOZ75077.1 glycosyltransferase [Clostridium pasteurianum DSM 525 = ATCC 6013]AOZ78872.1 glycosyltransferase [Clostridium pasteurianum]ELP59681.1 bactoprenol glucosyl transferase [Clostridium pasteurianum DSM 525 